MAAARRRLQSRAGRHPSPLYTPAALARLLATRRPRLRARARTGAAEALNSGPRAASPTRRRHTTAPPAASTGAAIAHCSRHGPAHPAAGPAHPDCQRAWHGRPRTSAGPRADSPAGSSVTAHAAAAAAAAGGAA
jgi:hypothetical protein